MMTEDVAAIFELIQSTGVWAIFMYLYLSEKKMHELTRIAYRNDLREVAELRNESPR